MQNGFVFLQIAVQTGIKYKIIYKELNELENKDNYLERKGDRINEKVNTQF